MYREITKCRICGNRDLRSVLDLGEFALTGVFPRSKDEPLTSGPLELVKCHGSGCGLLQLRLSYPLEEMYGNNYGYRSGLNASMVRHLHGKVARIQRTAKLSEGDLVIDIGSNDSTLLKGYSHKGLRLVGIDPTGKKFGSLYPSHIALIPDFFSEAALRRNLGTQKAKVVTSIAMFYDLENPIDFMRQVHSVLDDDGIWVFEQSYMPVMLTQNAYDTVCHEHLEYYGLRQIMYMAERAGFKIIDIEFNSINGGSFSVTVAKKKSVAFAENRPLIRRVLDKEKRQGIHTLRTYREFKKRVFAHREQLCRFIDSVKAEKKKIVGYGASTKGNVILQFCGFDSGDIPYIADINEDKFGCFTPGTGISIVSERQAKEGRPEYLLVLPWHFKDSIVERERNYLKRGGCLVIPLPELEVIRK